MGPKTTCKRRGEMSPLKGVKKKQLPVYKVIYRGHNSIYNDRRGTMGHILLYRFQKKRMWFNEEKA